MSEQNGKTSRGCRSGCLALAVIAGVVVVALAIVATFGIASLTKQFSGGHTHKLASSAKLDGGEDEIPMLQEVWSSGAASGTKVVRIPLTGTIMLGEDGWMENAGSASAALRAEGNEGRFIDLPGMRELPDSVDASAFAVVGIRLEHYNTPRGPMPGDSYRTLGWVRPRLTGGQAVLPVLWSDEYNAWIPADRKKNRPLE